MIEIETFGGCVILRNRESGLLARLAARYCIETRGAYPLWYTTTLRGARWWIKRREVHSSRHGRV